MKVVILAGGFGTRISEESAVRPKPMVEIGDKPILSQMARSTCSTSRCARVCRSA
jgi:NDP-sugar pyrophosphorylase family protein